MAHKLRHGPNSWLKSGNKLVPHFCHMTGKQGIGRGHASLCRAWEVEVQAQPGSVSVLTDSSSPDLLWTAKERKTFNTAARTRIKRDKTTPTYDVHSRQCNLSDIQLKSDSRDKPQHKNPFVWMPLKFPLVGVWKRLKTKNSFWKMSQKVQIILAAKVVWSIALNIFQQWFLPFPAK